MYPVRKTRFGWTSPFTEIPRLFKSVIHPALLYSLQVSDLWLSCWLTWKAPRRSRSLVTRYQVTYRKGDKDGYEKWLKSDQCSLFLRCSAKKIQGIEVRPYCGQKVKGPEEFAITLVVMPKDVQTSCGKGDVETIEEDRALPSTPAVPQLEMSAQVLIDGRDLDWQPGGIAVMPDGRLIITDMDNDCLRISTISSTKGLCAKC